MPRFVRRRRRSRSVLGAAVLAAAIAATYMPAELHAQGLVANGFKFGLGHEIGLEKYIISDDSSDPRNPLGLRAGMFWTFWMAGGRLAFQPEILAAYNRYSKDLAEVMTWQEDGTQQPVGQGTVGASRFELSVPVLLKLNLNTESGAVTSIYLGPTVGVGLLASTDRSEVEWDYGTGPIEMGGVTGFSVSFGRYMIDLRATLVGPDTYLRWQTAGFDGPTVADINPALDLSATFGVMR